MDWENIDSVAWEGGRKWRSTSVLENEILIPIERHYKYSEALTLEDQFHA